MARYTKTGTPNTVGQLNAEFNNIENAITDTLSRKGDSPNQMESLLDMNSYPIINLPPPFNDTSPVRLIDIKTNAETVNIINNITKPTTNNTFGSSRKFEMIAHRGFKGSNPEHTMLAYTTAVRQGADTLELDLQVTSDGVVVVFHDNLMETKTNLSGRVADKTLSQVQAATYDAVQSSPVYDNVRIPTLAEVIEYAKEVDVKLFIEIKDIRTFADIALMINQVKTAGLLDKSSFTSFQMDRVVEARRVEPDVEVGLIGGASLPAEYTPLFNNLSALGGKLVIVWNNTSVIDNPDLVAYARSLDIDISCYTLTNSTSVRKLVALGVTRIIADVPLRGR